MKLTWLGHSGFRLEIAGQVLLVDPWLSGNPSFPEDRWQDAVSGVTAVLLSHGHGDHASNIISIAQESGLAVYCIHELANWLSGQGVQATGFGKGGTVQIGEVSVTMVTAVHSSSIDFADAPLYAGGEAGFVIRGEGHSIYFSGDTDVTMEMDIIADRYKPDIGILCAGGHYTMDMEGAAYAAKRFFDFKTVIPCHYKTFPVLEQSAQPLIDALPEVDVRVMTVMEPEEL
ncbi:metal-dependent hydrolase [Donghicola sp. XS_ASV15]|uniref:metal-dependent hydrolase n=1 Tax=Donghicola sp. XS_ASV15 TaxID=3241295 RepID=UPI003519590B